MMVETFAPAKINLALHVIARRGDGYHLLDSLVVFADVGDRLFVTPADTVSLKVTGPFADDVPTGPENLIFSAASLIYNGEGAVIELEKNLPVASGIGGGSADAAATLTALTQLWGVGLPDRTSVLELGADVPVCLLGRPARMGGIGADLVPTDLPCLDIVLVNPGVGVATPKVFAGLSHRENPPLGSLPENPLEPGALLCWLEDQRNDLEKSASDLAPEIRETLTGLASQDDCLLARMSGSGATCFGLFGSSASAKNAACSLSNAHPGWWVQTTKTLS